MDGLGVNLLTPTATTKLTNIANVPNPSGEMPHHQSASVPMIWSPGAQQGSWVLWPRANGSL